MKKVYCFDIDGTLCSQVTGNYEDAVPFPARIESLNRLKAAGHVIKIFTSRGAVSGIDWSVSTEKQLAKWGLHYDELIMGKPHADIYIDDKAVHPDDFDWNSSP